MTREQFGTFVASLIKPLGIDTVTLYTPDPWELDDSYRLFLMHGIRDEIPMFGAARSESIMQRLFDQPQRSFCIPRVAHSALFQKSTFARREQLASVIRFHLLTDPPHSRERPGAILFFSYRQTQGFEVDYLARVEVAASAIEAIISQLGR